MDSPILEFGWLLMQKGLQSKIKNRIANSLDPDETARYESSHLDLQFAQVSVWSEVLTVPLGPYFFLCVYLMLCTEVNTHQLLCTIRFCLKTSRAPDKALFQP